MALPSAFQERVEQIEETRNQRLSLLEEERQLQQNKSLQLATKLSNIRSMEQRCLFLDHHNSAMTFNILAHKSQLDRLHLKYNTSAQQFRELKSELAEMEEGDKHKDKFYHIKTSEMKTFKEKVDKRLLQARRQAEEMRKNVEELKSSLGETLGKNECLSNPEVTAAERQKAELLVIKENLERTLASNYHLRAQLEKQLYRMLISQEEGRNQVNLSTYKVG